MASTIRRARPDTVRLLPLGRPLGLCPLCGSATVAAGRFAVDVDGGQPCGGCLPGQLGEQAAEFVIFDLEHVALRLASLPRGSQRAIAARLLLDAAQLLAAEYSPDTAPRPLAA